jgi:hypothetical protein
LEKRTSITAAQKITLFHMLFYLLLLEISIIHYMHFLLKNGFSLGDVLSESDLLIVISRIQCEAESWYSHSRPGATALVNPAAAVSALGELTPGGALMKGFEEESLAREY